MNELIDNYYFSRLVFVIFISLIGLGVINNLKNKDKVNVKDRINFKKIDIHFLLRMILLSMFLRIVFEQIIMLSNLDLTITIGPSNVFEILAEFIATCIFAPVFEEIIFRFGLYEKLNKKCNYIISIVITSIIFSLIHLYKIDGLIILFIISLIWNYSYYKTKNLFYPIVLHFIHNIYALIGNINRKNVYYIISGLVCLMGYMYLKLKKQKN